MSLWFCHRLICSIIGPCDSEPLLWLLYLEFCHRPHCSDIVPLVLTPPPCSDTVPLFLILSLQFCHLPHHLSSLSDIVPSFRYRPVCSVIVVMVLSSLPLLCHRPLCSVIFHPALASSNQLCHCPLCSVIVPLLCHCPPCSVIVSPMLSLLSLFCHRPPVRSSSSCTDIVPFLCHRQPASSRHQIYSQIVSLPRLSHPVFLRHFLLPYTPSGNSKLWSAFCVIARLLWRYKTVEFV